MDRRKGRAIAAVQARGNTNPGLWWCQWNGWWGREINCPGRIDSSCWRRKGSWRDRSQISGVSGQSHLENKGVIDIVKEAGQGVAKELDCELRCFPWRLWLGPSLVQLTPLSIIALVGGGAGGSYKRFVCNMIWLTFLFFYSPSPVQCLEVSSMW